MTDEAVIASQIVFTKGPGHENITIVSDFMKKKLKILRANTKYSTIKKRIKYVTKYGVKNNISKSNLVDFIMNEVEKDVVNVRERYKTLYYSRLNIATRLRTYACDDRHMIDTVPLYSYQFQSNVPIYNPTIPNNLISNKNNLIASESESINQSENRSESLSIIQDKTVPAYEVKVLLQQDHAKVWTIDNFISHEECQTLINDAGGRLERATVSGANGGSVVSESRKAQQAAYSMSAGASDPLWPLYNRALEIVNHHAGYNITPDGQEPLTVIQYNVGDEYKPHCDSSCGENMDHSKGGRVATALLYCKVADEGGATTFVNSNVYVTPKSGSVVFFSYMGKDDKRMDPMKFTEHTGCPVAAGEKWITTFWMRSGVNKTSPFGHYGTSGEISMGPPPVVNPLIYPNATTAFKTKIDCCKGSLYKIIRNMFEYWLSYDLRVSLSRYSFLAWLSKRYEIPEICEFDTNSYCNMSSPIWWTEIMIHISENIFDTTQTKIWKDYIYKKYPTLIPPIVEKYYQPLPPAPKYDQCGNVISGPGYVHPSVSEFLQVVESDRIRAEEEANARARMIANEVEYNQQYSHEYNNEYNENNEYMHDKEESRLYNEELLRRVENPASPPPIQGSFPVDTNIDNHHRHHHYQQQQHGSDHSGSDTRTDQDDASSDVTDSLYDL